MTSMSNKKLLGLAFIQTVITLLFTLLSIRSFIRAANPYFVDNRTAYLILGFAFFLSGIDLKNAAERWFRKKARMKSFDSVMEGIIVRVMAALVAYFCISISITVESSILSTVFRAGFYFSFLMSGMAIYDLTTV